MLFDANSGGGLFGVNAKISETPTASVYCWAIFSKDRYDSPTLVDGKIWTDISGDINTVPDGPGKASPWIGWEPSPAGQSANSTIIWNIAFSQAAITLLTAQVPEPAALMLAGFGIADLRLHRCSMR